MKTLLRLGVAAIAAIAISQPALAQHDDHDGHDHGSHDHGSHDAPAYDEAAMMEAWMKAATPGEAHAELMTLAGEWDAAMTTYEMGKEPETSTGTASYEVLFDGRVLRGTFHGTMMGMPMQGLSLEGYDNVSGEYWSTWVDNMGTGIGVMRGTKQADGSIEYEGDMSSPMGPMHMRMIATRPSEDEAKMVMYVTMGGMPEFKNMEITYTRKGV